MSHLDTPAVQERGGPDDNGIGPVATHCLEGSIDLGAGVGIVNLDFQSNGASGRIHVLHLSFAETCIGRV
ncbi:MAG: hypothetical protein WA710_18830, partial [Pseudolabrys sp.]